MTTLAEKIAIMQAYERGEKIEFYTDEGWKLWAGVYEPSWNWPNYEYRIAPLEPKKIKLFAWLVDHQLKWFEYDCNAPHELWKRVPSEDKEITVL
jgi:hypothetical protein